MRDQPDNHDSEPMTFDAADLALASRILGQPFLKWAITSAVDPPDEHTRRLCVDAFGEAVGKHQGAELGRAVRLAALLVLAGLEPAQPTDESC
jgi:hypothetical protein